MKVSSPKVATSSISFNIQCQRVNRSPVLQPHCAGLCLHSLWQPWAADKGDFNASHIMAMCFQTRAANPWEEDMEKAGKKFKHEHHWHSFFSKKHFQSQARLYSELARHQQNWLHTSSATSTSEGNCNRI